MRFGLFLLAAQFPGQDHTTVLDSTVAAAVAAEAAGFDDVWVAEHHFMSYGICPSAIALAGYLLGATRRITVGTAVSVLSTQHPIAIAEQTALLDQLSGGRFCLGVGRGGPWVDLEVFGTGQNSYQHGFAEALGLLLAALTSPRVAATGPRFCFPEVDIVPRPYTRPRPEVVVAVTTAPTAKLAARCGLPMLLDMHANDSEKAALITHYQQFARGPGRHLAASLAYVADSQHEALVTMRSCLPRWLGPGLAGYRRADGNPHHHRDPRDYTELLCRLHPVGTAEHCRTMLAETARRQAVEEFGMAARFAPVVGWALPAAELMVAVAVLPSASAVAACCAALALLVAFTAAVVGQLRQGRHPSCSCFGAASTAPISSWTLARNAGIAVLVAVTLYGSWTQGHVPGQLPADHAVALAVIVALGAIQLRQASTMRALRRQLDQTRTTPSKPEGLPVGTLAPEFDLPGIDGTRATLGELVGAGRPIALVFLHPQCGPCHGLAGELPQWHQRHHSTLTLMPIGSGELASNSAWAREHHLAQMLVQDHLEVALRYRLRGTPTAVLIDTRGRIAAPPARGPVEIRELLTDPTTTPTRS